MSALRYFRHGPLLFWCATTFAIATTTYVATQTAAGPPPVVATTAASTWSDVESWRASLIQVPIAATTGDVAQLGDELAAVAESNADAAADSGLVDLESAWRNAATSARLLAATDPTDATALAVSVRALGVSGDALAAVAAGSPWVYLAPSAGSSSGGSVELSGFTAVEEEPVN